jgi:putative isomerase
METLQKYIDIIRSHLLRDYTGMFREPGGALIHPFITPGSKSYADVLWDWDSWLSDVALRQILAESASEEEKQKAFPYEKGCILNFLHLSRKNGNDGWTPICLERKEPQKPGDIYSENMHKPCLAQHAAFLVRENGNDAQWLREFVPTLQAFINNYRNHHRHDCGLYFWQNDWMIGVDNDPCTFGRPPRSSGSIYLNCLMYRELLAFSYILDCLDLKELSAQYLDDANHLKQAIQEYSWDERDGFFYSVDLNLVPMESYKTGRHIGHPRDWQCLIQRIGVWSGFMALWSGVAAHDQAERVEREHYRNEKTFGAPFGLRTLSRMEKMYQIRASSNPSCWLGPVWGISNYLTFRGFVRYGLDDAARDLAEKTIRLFGCDLERFGVLHEYYDPETGEPILNPGFQNWNYLVLNMIAWFEGKKAVEEF